MKLLDSRRLTGPNIVTDGPGAIIDAQLEGADTATVLRVWGEKARLVLREIGWEDEQLAFRELSRGLSLVISAPIDALYAATEVNEWAWEATVAEVAGGEAEDLATAATRLRETIAAERNPRLLALRDAALERGVLFLSDDEFASVGSGTGAHTWPVDGLPEPNEVDWSAVHDVPVALVTGSNGKTTTVRLLAAVARAAGLRPGFCSTDGIYLGEKMIEPGDYSGPGGARAVLRNREVQIALLETARGGMLRRGLSVPHAEAAMVTNIASDHLGEYGVGGTEEVADAKLVIAKAVSSRGVMVLNSDDPILAGRNPAVKELVWFGLSADSPRVAQSLKEGGDACYVADDTIVEHRQGVPLEIARVDRLPIALGGAARYNVSNALGVVALARGLGLPTEAIRDGLRSFVPTPESSPGRTNLFRGREVTILVDFVHNPEGMEAIADAVGRMPGKRRLIVLGQAGDRDDRSIREMVRAAGRLQPERIIIKEMEKYLRGRAPGEVPGIIEAAARESSPTSEITRAPSELAAVREALAWARPGDILIIPSHAEREAVIREVQAWLRDA